MTKPTTAANPKTLAEPGVKAALEALLRQAAASQAGAAPAQPTTKMARKASQPAKK